MLVVLKAPEIPSVLLELGYLSSHSDVKQLESPEWREKTHGNEEAGQSAQWLAFGSAHSRLQDKAANPHVKSIQLIHGSLNCHYRSKSKP